MSVLIWIQTLQHSDSIPERLFEKVNFEKKSADNNKSMKNYRACKELMHKSKNLINAISKVLD